MRCFIALPLPAQTREELHSLTEPFRERWPGLGWVGVESYHLTLAFLGEQGPAGVAAARAALLTCASLPGPRCSVRNLLTFPPRGPWRVLAAEIGQEPTVGPGDDKAFGKRDEVLYLHRRINEALAREARQAGLEPLNEEWPDADEVGSKPRRPFRAHVTLARQPSLPRPGCPPADRTLELPQSARIPDKGPLRGFRIDTVLLYKSELHPSGAVYTELERISLA